MRFLRPDQVFVLPSGLWVLDVLQPVAAVLDPDDGTVRRMVAWREVPPAPAADEGESRRVRSDGSGLWTQQTASGPLVRVDLDGVGAAVWTGGLLLAACGPGVAWCAPAPPVQELVAGPDPLPLGGRLLGSRLLRVTADGACATVGTDGPGRAVRADEDGLLVEVDVEGWSLRPLGAGTAEVVRPTRWLRLPWDADLPRELTVAEHGLPEDVVLGPRTDGGG